MKRMLTGEYKKSLYHNLHNFLHRIGIIKKPLYRIEEMTVGDLISHLRQYHRTKPVKYLIEGGYFVDGQSICDSVEYEGTVYVTYNREPALFRAFLEVGNDHPSTPTEQDFEKKCNKESKTDDS